MPLIFKESLASSIARTALLYPLATSPAASSSALMRVNSRVRLLTACSSSSDSLISLVSALRLAISLSCSSLKSFSEVFSLSLISLIFQSISLTSKSREFTLSAASVMSESKRFSLLTSLSSSIFMEFRALSDSLTEASLSLISASRSASCSSQAEIWF